MLQEGRRQPLRSRPSHGRSKIDSCLDSPPCCRRLRRSSRDHDQNDGSPATCGRTYQHIRVGLTFRSAGQRLAPCRQSNRGTPNRGAPQRTGLDPKSPRTAISARVCASSSCAFSALLALQPECSWWPLRCSFSGSALPLPRRSDFVGDPEHRPRIAAVRRCSDSRRLRGLPSRYANDVALIGSDLSACFGIPPHVQAVLICFDNLRIEARGNEPISGALSLAHRTRCWTRKHHRPPMAKNSSALLLAGMSGSCQHDYACRLKVRNACGVVSCASSAVRQIRVCTAKPAISTPRTTSSLRCRYQVIVVDEP